MTELTWPADQFYWAVIEAPGVRAAHGIPEGLLSVLQEDLPLSAESIHAVGVGTPIEDGRLVVCAAKRDALREVAPDVLRLSPSELPAFIERKLDPSSFNLLVGEFEPVALREERGRRRTIMTAAAAVVACLLAIGLARRAEVWNQSGDLARASTASLTSSIAPNISSSGGPLALQVELDHLHKAPCAEPKALTSPDAALALASMLSVWPKELECQTESVSVGPLVMTLSLTVAKDARPFLFALKPPEGWTLEEPRLTATSDGSRLHMTLHRKEARP